MNRRSFLKLLGVGVPAVVVAPAALKALEPSTSDNFDWKVINCQPVRQLGIRAWPDEPEPKGWVKYRFHMAVSAPPRRCESYGTCDDGSASRTTLTPWMVK